MEDKEITEIKAFLEKLEVKFDNINIFVNAFVHRSYLNENSNFKHKNNERLEFLGDAVLELVVTKYLFEKYEEKPEGELTAFRSALVRGKNLSEIATNIGLIDHIFLSAGERKSSEKAKSLILANTLEALIGAIYLDLGYDSASEFITKNIILKNIKKIITDKLYIDAKSEFQEKVQEKYKITPKYIVVNESGPDHNKTFVCAVYIDTKQIAKADGNSKGDAEQNAATEALKQLF